MPSYPKPFGVKHCRTAVHLINHVSISSVEWRGSKQTLWSREKRLIWIFERCSGARHLYTFLEMRDPKLDSKVKSNASSSDTEMKSLDTDCGTRLTRKSYRSRDVVFFEDQTIEDINQA
jgi:hypothetical protein